MITPDSLNSVALFHKIFKSPILSTPQIPSIDRQKLRVNLLVEELKELQEAILDKDIVEVADALADLQYVLSGAVLEFGLGDKFKEIFDEVQRSNMSKACDTIEEAKATQEFYFKRDNVTSYYYEDTEIGKFLVFRTEDDKTLKSINYSAAKLRPILDK